MEKISLSNYIVKLKEIQHSRTHCQCSREKVVEKIAFDRIIEKVEKKYRSDPNREDLVRYLDRSMNEFPNTSPDHRVFMIAYGYAVACANRMPSK